MKYVLAVLLLGMSLVAQASPDQRFTELLDEHWAWFMSQHPEYLTYRGDRSGNDRWTDMSLAAHIERDNQRGEFQRRLQAIEITALSEDNQLNYRMFQRRLEGARKEQALGLNLMSLNMRDGPQHQYTVLEYTPMQDEVDNRNWLARMQALPTLLAQYRELLEEGVSFERVQPRAVMERVPAQLDNSIADSPEYSPFYRPFKRMPATMDAQLAEELQAQARSVIANQVTPAYRDFKDFFVNTYLPASRPEPGVASLPGGDEIYRYLAMRFTTTDMTPEEIHETGKGEVARILAEMEDVKSEVGFDGDLQAFNEFLRTDPQFYYETPEALLEAYQAVSKRLDPELVSLFGKLPRMPYGVKPIPAETAPDTTTAYYMPPAINGSRAGYYYVNLYRPEVRPKYEIEVLSVHEAVPGHHLQIALAQELTGLPEFRRASGVTAFVEGWGLYSERLGYQMGLYTDPYSRYGQLTYDMWRAVRLVVDTGIHYFGWSRQEAIDYFKANAGKSEADIVNEIDRYIGWPGQALAYKIGQLKILELRATAEARLGERFDIRSFHDELLGAGAIPLDALQARMDAWMARQ